MPQIIRIDPGALSALQGAQQHIEDIDRHATKRQMSEDLGRALQAAVEGGVTAYVQGERRNKARDILGGSDTATAQAGASGEDSRRADGAGGYTVPEGAIEEAPGWTGGTGKKGGADALAQQAAVDEYVRTGDVKSLSDLIDRRERAAADAAKERRALAREERLAQQAQEREDRLARQHEESNKISRGHLKLAQKREGRAVRGEMVRGAEKLVGGLLKVPRMAMAQRKINALVEGRKAEGKPITVTDLMAIDAWMQGKEPGEAITRTLPGMPPPASTMTAGSAAERTADQMLAGERVDWVAVQEAFDADPSIDADERVLIGKASSWASKQDPAALRRAIAALPQDPGSPIRAILEGRLASRVDESVRLAMPSIEQALQAPTDEEAAKQLGTVLAQHGISEDDYAGWVIGERRRQAEGQGWRLPGPEEERVWTKAKPGTVPLYDPAGRLQYLTAQQAEAMGFILGR